MKNLNFSLLFKANFLLTTIFALLFLRYNLDYTPLSLSLAVAGVISTVATIYLLIFAMLFLFTFTKRFILLLSSLFFVLLNISLVVDFFIYSLYKFHINGMVINILTSPDAMDSMQIGTAPILLFLFFVVTLIGFEIFIIKKTFGAPAERKDRLNRKLNKIILIPLVLIILTDKISYGVASLLKNSDVVSKYGAIPLYQPLTFNKIGVKYFGIKQDKESQDSIKLNGKLNYPLKPIELCANPTRPNIIIIASDSVRNSVLSSEVTPNIEEFKKDSLTFNNHQSGGNATRFGIFSIIYGVNSTYWFSFLDNAKAPVLFDVLKKLDYKIDITSSTNTSWPEFRQTCYADIPECVNDNFNGVPWERDKQSSEHFIKQLGNNNGKNPIFSFVFLDAPHGFSYPKDFNKFNATGDNINYLSATKGSKEIKDAFARYKNSVAYDDMLFKNMIDELKRKNMYDNSIIIFTSDHGQEFYEHGNFGHNSAFSSTQTNSPFIIKFPKNMKIPKIDTNQLTSHNEIVPTILSILGVKNSPSDYSNGYNLLDKNYKREYAFCASWNNNAIITNSYTYLFSNRPDKMFKNETRDTKTYEKAEGVKVDSKKVLDIINENKKFFN